MMNLFLSSLGVAWPRFLIFVIFGVSAAVLAWVGIDAFVAEYLVGYFGYYALAIVVLVSVPTILRAMDWRALGGRWNTRRYTLLGLLVLVSLLTVKLEPFDFKVVMDEPLLAAVSTSMHLDRLALYPGRGHDLEGAYVYLDGKVDKRPLLYPFLVSLFHDFTGHRVSNSFLLNGLLVPVFWWLVFTIGRRFSGGRDWGGMVTVALLFTAPLVSHLGTSGGFDFLNTTLLLACLYWAIRWREEPEREEFFAALVASLVLLGNTRYESPYWVLPFGLFIVSMWWRRKRITMPVIVIAAPLLMLPSLIHNQIHSKIGSMWQKGIFDRSETFSLDYVGENAEGAGIYFFDLGDTATNSYLLSVLALAGLLTIAGYLLTLRWNPAARLKPAEEVGIFFYLGLVGLFGILMAFNWGYFADYITARLSLPFVVGTGFAIPWSLWRMPRVFGLVGAVLAAFLAMLHVEAFSARELWETGIYLLVGTFVALFAAGFLVMRNRVEARWVLCLAIGYAMIVTVPRLNVHAYLERYQARTEINLLLSFAREQRDENVLIVSHLPVIPALEYVSAVSPVTFLRNKDLFHHRVIEQHAYSAVYYYVVDNYDPRSREWKRAYVPDLANHFNLELVESRLISPAREAHFYRVLSVREEPATPSAESGAAMVPPQGETTMKPETPLTIEDVY